jgi:hypothetical protein
LSEWSFLFFSFFLVGCVLGFGCFDAENWMMDDWRDGGMIGVLVVFLLPKLWEFLVRSWSLGHSMRMEWRE